MAGSDGRNMLVLRSRPAGYRRLPDAVRVADPRPLNRGDRRFSLCRYGVHRPTVAIYAQDSERKQSFAEAEQTYRAMLAAYRQHGYQLQELPRTSPDERADFLLDALGCR